MAGRAWALGAEPGGLCLLLLCHVVWSLTFMELQRPYGTNHAYLESYKEHNARYIVWGQ